MSCTQRAWAHLVLYVLLCIVFRCYKWCKSANAMRTEHMQEQWQMLSHGNQYSIRLVSCDVCSMVNFGRESRLMCPLGHVKQFSAVYIHELRSTSGHKRRQGQISNFINVNTKVSIRCSLSSEIRWYPFLWDVCNMFQYPFELYALFHGI